MSSKIRSPCSAWIHKHPALMLRASLRDRDDRCSYPQNTKLLFPKMIPFYFSYPELIFLRIRAWHTARPLSVLRVRTKAPTLPINLIEASLMCNLLDFILSSDFETNHLSSLVDCYDVSRTSVVDRVCPIANGREWAGPATVNLKIGVARNPIRSH